MARVSERTDVLFYLGNESPRISRELTSLTGGVTMPPGTTYKLLVRPRESDIVVLDEAMSVSGDSVYYDPSPGDFDTQGYFRAWVRIFVGGSTSTVQDTDEFNLIVIDHAPGYGVRTGAVARMTSRRVPVAWLALKNRPGYGDPGLQEIVDLTKLRWLPSGMTVSAEDEDSLDLRVTNFLALATALEVLKVAIEYWTGEIISQSVNGGGSEVVTYPDRIRAAEKLIEILSRDMSQARTEAEAVLGVAMGLGSSSGITLYDEGDVMTPGIVDPLVGYGSAHPWWCE